MFRMVYEKNTSPARVSTPPRYRQKRFPSRNTRQRATLEASDLFLPTPASEEQGTDPGSRAEGIERGNAESEGFNQQGALIAQSITTEQTTSGVQRTVRRRRKASQEPDMTKLQFKPVEQMAGKIRLLATEEKIRLMPSLDYMKAHDTINFEMIKRLHGRWARRVLNRLIELGIIVAVGMNDKHILHRQTVHEQKRLRGDRPSVGLETTDDGYALVVGFMPAGDDEEDMVTDFSGRQG